MLYKVNIVESNIYLICRIIHYREKNIRIRLICFPQLESTCFISPQNYKINKSVKYKKIYKVQVK